MALNAPLPRITIPLLDRGGMTSREWYLFFQALQVNVGSPSNADLANDIVIISDKLGSPDGTPENIPDGAGNGKVIGVQSIAWAGALPGIVQLTLQGDQDTPGNTTYYGTDTTGTKGFFAVSAAFLGTAGDITLTVDGLGVTTIDLADVTPTTGGTLQKYGFDAKGRRTQAAAATTDDLSEGTTNFYASLQHVYDRMKAVLMAGSNVTLTPNDPAHTITIAATGGGGTGLPSLVAQASENLAAGAMVQVYNVGGTPNVRNANAVDGTKPATGFVAAAVTSGAMATVSLSGSLNAGVSGLTPGSDIYLSDTTAGAVTATPPVSSGHLVQPLGVVLTATSFVFTYNPGIVRG